MIHKNTVEKYELGPVVQSKTRIRVVPFGTRKAVEELTQYINFQYKGQVGRVWISKLENEGIIRVGSDTRRKFRWTVHHDGIEVTETNEEEQSERMKQRQRVLDRYLESIRRNHARKNMDGEKKNHYDEFASETS